MESRVWTSSFWSSLSLVLTQLSVFSACRLTQIEKMPTNAIRVATTSSAATMRGCPEAPSPVEPSAAMVLRP
jgi:hypothetical protein